MFQLLFSSKHMKLEKKKKERNGYICLSAYRFHYLLELQKVALGLRLLLEIKKERFVA